MLADRQNRAVGLAMRLEEGACRMAWLQWDVAEASVCAFRGPRDPDVVAALRLCADCPVRQTCAEWARLDRYTGLAAGQLWKDGERVRWPSAGDDPEDPNRRLRAAQRRRRRQHAESSAPART